MIIPCIIGVLLGASAAILIIAAILKSTKYSLPDGDARSNVDTSMAQRLKSPKGSDSDEDRHCHQHDNETAALIKELLHTLRNIMAAIDNLTTNVTALATGVTALTGAVDTAVTDLGAPAASDAAIQVQADAVAALTTAVNAQTARLVTATGAVTPPAPTP